MGAGADTLVAAWYRGAWWLWLLRPVEYLFRSLAALRRWLYACGMLSVYRAPVPVVIVGNITVGGTGKTPVVIALVEALQARGIAVGVVSRGYGASRVTGSHLVNEHSAARDCGDEALLIHRRTGCPCAISPSRPQAVQALLAAAPVQLVLSDDGLQHYALGRDMEIAVLDAARGTGNGFCLPAGPLREPLSRLRRVDRVLHRGSDDSDSGFRYRAVALVNVASGEQRPAAPGKQGERVHAVAGIGQPDQFFATLEKLGFQVQPHAFGDHHDFSALDFSALAGKPIIMTEKDAVKCRTLAGANAWYLKIEAQLPPPLIEEVAALARP
jgi:tetraacyldisaccharide 4'-kinase